MEELKTLGTIAVALFGVFLTHRFTSKRDVENSGLNKTGIFVDIRNHHDKQTLTCTIC
jgi:hypothetical protein